ncbi:hypothetical protein [Haloarcula sp. 1CSR25-25]|uniref:hypothetical protein n=1 Tax=Haloarcula sp. 1CSR25-25 TaxID=2862545 RepID=UPI0028947158|nr:hypothetical protein [Haloarcula sp. 1CSR25-25]MDT3434660.1 hypothetical protein [Haloarcula sp. 1CSR25-25]
MSPANPNAPADHLHDALEILCQALSPTEFPAVENWQIAYGPGMSRYSRAPYWNPLDGHDNFGRDTPTTVVRLLYSPTGATVRSDWISHMNYISIRFGSDWNPEYNQDEDGDAVMPSSEAGLAESSRVADKYMIGGPLCDPVVTGEVETATQTLFNQFSRLKAGADLNHILEVLAACRSDVLISDDYGETLPAVEDCPADLFDGDVDTTSPLRSISGIGATTVKRFASRVGVYPNLRTIERDNFNGLLPGYDNNPDLDEMDDVIDAITEQYQQLSKQSDWPSGQIDVDQFAGYPVGNPMAHGDV